MTSLSELTFPEYSVGETKITLPSIEVVGSNDPLCQASAWNLEYIVLKDGSELSTSSFINLSDRQFEIYTTDFTNIGDYTIRITANHSDPPSHGNPSAIMKEI